MTIPPLGRLERVELREAWISESSDFTPWLAQEENLKLLGDAIGLDLALEAVEQWVGPFRADIVCKNTTDGAWVLVENQLEPTDHTHLGQLLTYAAGLKAVTIVWIARRFTDEHRAALDWLNEMTSESVNFFGLEIEVWRIGESARAPKLNIVSKPNEWVKGPLAATPDLSATQQLYAEWFTGLMAYISEHNRRVKAVKAMPQNWANFGVGRSTFSLQATVVATAKRLDVNLAIFDPNSKPHFQLLLTQRQEIEREAGETLGWNLLPAKKSSYIVTHLYDADPANRADWPRQHQWMAQKLDLFHGVFSARVKALNAADYAPDASMTNGDAATIPEEFPLDNAPQ